MKKNSPPQEAIMKTLMEMEGRKKETERKIEGEIRRMASAD